MTISKPAVKKRASSTTAAAKKTPKRAGAGARAKPAPSATAVAAKPKQKLVRDSFTIPKPEYAVLEALKQRAATLMRPTKKSELLRAGIFALNAMNDRAFLATLGRIPSLKTGRPRKAPTATAATTRTAEEPASA